MPIPELLATCFPAHKWSIHLDTLRVAACDESGRAPVLPMAVVWPENTQDVQTVVEMCDRTCTPMTARGGGSSLEGSSVPSPGGIVIDFSRMNKILSYAPADLQVTVEPGIIFDDLNRMLEKDGLFFPPSPGGSGNLATIGGMVNTNASGIYTVKYGATKEYILGLEIVTAVGGLLRLGGKAMKRSSGYNLVELICGSEGTLALITSITLRLAGRPEAINQSAWRFSDEASAARTVSEIRASGVDIAAIEFLDRRTVEALNLLKQYGLDERPTLLMEFHGTRTAVHENESLAAEITQFHGGNRVRLPNDESPWRIRHFVTEAIKQRKPGYRIIRNDIAFPLSRLPEMVTFCLDEGDKCGLLVHTFGHVGMGLLHALILAQTDAPVEMAKAASLNRRMIEKAVELGGTISGEHGIGLAHRDLLPLEHGNSVQLMRAIKRTFDPKGILNPDKVLPEREPRA